MAESPPITIEITTAGPRLEAIKAFYATCGYTGPTESKDDVILARTGDTLVGVVRLVQERAVHLLRGMYLRQDLQRHGIGSKMLKKFELLANTRRLEEIFLTCGPHLEGFYGQIGFHKAGPSIDPPSFLVQRSHGYSSRHGEQIIMYRLTAGGIP
jgi:N-acetylglutamate synthase-like GNAT family acetyltransferase